MSDVRSPGAIPFRDQAWWGLRSTGEPLSVVQLIRAGTLDSELAALLWLLVEARLPLFVAAGPQGAGKTTVLRALLDFLPSGVTARHLEGFAEDFRWLPEAGRLGWRPESGAAEPAETGRTGVGPASTYLVASELSPHLPFYTWGEHARIAVRALSVGYGLGATVHADSLQELFDLLRGPSVRLTDDELSHLGVVLVLHAFRDGHGVVRRVQAAHYVRPVSRDRGGHVQRLSPAVLATWDAGGDSFEHFAWGVVPELADRVGRRAGDFEAEHARRRDLLTALVAAGVEAPADVRAAIDGYRLTATGHRH